MLGRKYLPNKVKRRRKLCTKKITTGVSGARNGYNRTQREMYLMVANFEISWRNNIILKDRGTARH